MEILFFVRVSLVDELECNLCRNLSRESLSTGCARAWHHELQKTTCHIKKKEDRRRQEESRDQITHYRAVFSFYSSRLLFSLTSLVINAPTLAVREWASKSAETPQPFFFSWEQNTFNEPDFFASQRHTRIKKKKTKKFSSFLSAIWVKVRVLCTQIGVFREHRCFYLLRISKQQERK